MNDPWLWPEIWHVNEQIENPHLIYPGDVIKLIYVDGKPKLTVDRPPKDVERTFLSNGTVKLSPKVRSSELDTVIPAIPLDTIQSFLVEHRVVDPELLVNAPYVLAGGDMHIVMGSGDKLYARGKVDQNFTMLPLVATLLSKLMRSRVTGSKRLCSFGCSCKRSSWFHAGVVFDPLKVAAG